MDAERFDDLVRGLLSEISRRRGIGALLAGMLGPLGYTLTEAKRNRKKKQRKRQKKRKQKRKNRPCYPGTNCLPGPGKNNARCNFSDSARLFELDAREANLSETNFTGAQLAGANLAGADLSGACLVGANLLSAILDDSTNLNGAVFCRTLMPDGSINDDDCDKGSRCCPTPDPICKTCSGSDCITTPETVCSILGTPCCPGLACTATAEIVVTTCQAPCDTDDDCVKLFGSGIKCCPNQTLLCPFFPGGRCCQQPGWITCE